MASPIKKEIKALLSKQNLSGDDVGRLMILDFLSAYQSLNEGGDSKGLLSDAEKTAIVNGLLLSDEIQRFNDYRGLHDYLASAPVIAESFAKTYEVYRLRLLHLLANMKQAEEESHYSKQRPVVMTKRQFELFLQSGDAAPAKGIAVLQDFPHADSLIDENGLYNEPHPKYRLDYMAENILLQHADFIKEALNVMQDMLAECLARKKALELMASFTKLPQIKILIVPPDVENLELMNKFMSKIPLVLHRHDKSEENSLRDKLSAILVPIDLSALEPTMAAIKKARRGLNFSVIKNNSEAFVASLKREWRNDC